MITVAYNRKSALEYARRWAYGRNPLFYNFAGIGGDCTSFVSQCVYAGSCTMNHSSDGWYYDNINHRSPSWSGVAEFYDFMVKNRTLGPFATETRADGLELGDVVQFRNEQGRFYHSVLVTGFAPGTYLVSAHNNDAFNRRLDSYRYADVRFLHIEGVRMDGETGRSCFRDFYNGTSFSPT